MKDFNIVRDGKVVATVYFSEGGRVSVDKGDGDLIYGYVEVLPERCCRCCRCEGTDFEPHRPWGRRNCG